jgi:hypothetical protein
MAEYKIGNLLTQSYDSKYDDEHSPGVDAPYPGIYRCVACGDEVGIAKGNKLPPQNHRQHTSNSKIKWKLLVRAIQQ